jgi:ABC-type glycerol-3-phosphate transport system substrate-binding protein
MTDNETSRGMNRRNFLTAGALFTVGGALAACSSNNGSGGTSAGTSAPATTSAAGTSSAAASSASQSASGAASSATSAASSAASAATTSAPAANFSGIALNVACNPTDVQAATAAGKLWAARTGGSVTATVIPYAERATDYATMIVSQDPHWDVLFASVDFVSNFGDRIYDDLGDIGGMTSDLIPAALGQLTKGGKLYAAPLFADMEFFIYNKSIWTKAGLDPANVPTTWDELYALAPKLSSGGQAANVTPLNTIGTAYWISFYNSLGGQLFNEDKTQLLFNNDKALKTWQSFEAGFKAKFFDVAAANATGDADTQLIFNQGNAASEINTVGFWAEALSTDPQYKVKIKPEDVGVTIMPGIDAGTHGSVIVSEGFGVNKFGKHKDAALDFVKFTASPEFQKQLVLGKAGTVLPPSSKSVAADPDVVAAFPIAPLLVEQAKYQLTWPGNAPFNWNAAFTLALTNLSKGTWTAQQAHDETVKAVQKLIVNYVAGN